MRRSPEPFVRTGVGAGTGTGLGVGAVEVEIVLRRDLAPGDRSVVGTLERVGTVEGLRVPVRAVPSNPEAGEALSAGTRLRSSASLEPDEPGGGTSFVAFLRGRPSPSRRRDSSRSPIGYGRRSCP
ncbi:hypothetical protein P9139_12730 [Curtobacterium flaccumfaciens]|nr:hypothetical protein P9139_12730 [Curtobacterium flaccumfaciens]